MKAFILTEGGRSIGFGHVTRCIALYEAFREKGAEVKLLVDGDDTLSDLQENKDCRIFNWLREKDKMRAITEAADIVIIDSYRARRPVYDEIFGRVNKGLVMVDDYNRMEYPPGIIINPSINSGKLCYSPGSGAVYLTGKDYVILRKEFLKIPKKIINKDVKTILITFGGMDHSQMAREVSEYLTKNFHFKCRMVDPAVKKISAKEMLQLMLEADICVSGGGQTTYELARIGVPTTAMCLYENQKHNMETWQELGFLEHVDLHGPGYFLQNIDTSIRRLLPHAERIKRSQIGRRIVDGRGAGRIVDTLIKTLFQKQRS